MPAALFGDLSSASYSLSDMAADTVGLLDALASKKRMSWARPWGARLPKRWQSSSRTSALTSMMSTTRCRGAGLARGAPRAFLRAACDHPRSVICGFALSYIIGSPGIPVTSIDAHLAGIGPRFRSYGSARQAVATIASGDRTEKLRKLQVPTLVIHGLADRMCDVSGGQPTAESIPGA